MMNKHIILLFVAFLVSQYVTAQTNEVPAQLDFATMHLTISNEARQQIQKKVEHLQSDTAFLAHTRDKIFTYMPIVKKVLKAQNAPEDFAYIALKESEFLQSNADDRKIAAGIWKISPNQNEDWKLNLLVTSKVDERKHIGLSTAAIARKCANDNYTLRNWINTLLALRVGMLEISGTTPPEDKGKTTYEVHQQTNPYLLDLLAYYLVFKNEVKPTRKVATLLEYNDSQGKNIDDIARLGGLTSVDLKGYNTWLLDKTVPKDSRYTVYFPTYSALQQAEINNSLIKNNTLLPIEQTHQIDYPLVVKKQQINVDSKGYQLVSANGLSAIMVDSKDKIDNVLKVANSISKRKFVKYNEIGENDTIQPNVVYYLEEKKKSAVTPFHELKRGETYWLVAQKYGMRYDKLLDYNRIEKGEKEQLGRILWIADQRPKDTHIDIRPQQPTEVEPQFKPTTQTVVANGGFSEDDKGKYYTTTMNETVYEIASKVRITLDSLRTLNPEIGNAMTVEANTKLLLAHKNTTTQIASIPKTVPIETLPTQGNESDNVKKIAEAVIKANQDTQPTTDVALVHIVQKGDWLNVIAKKYGVTTAEIMTWNNITDANAVKINDKLLIKNPKKGFSMADIKTVAAASKTATENENIVKETVVKKDMPKDTTKIVNEQPFLKDSVYLVRTDGETLESIEQKLKLPKIGTYNYSLYFLKTYNNIDDVTTPLSKGRTIQLGEKPVLPSAVEIAKVMGTTPTTNQVATNTVPAVKDNTTQPINTTPVTDNTVPNIVTANTDKVVMYSDYKDSIYIVGTGDYLYSIAKKTGVPDYRYIMRWNNITDENKKLDIGDRLVVKGDLSKPEYKAITNGKYHTIQFGENIYQIAKLYNTKADSLAKWNKIAADSVLQVGKSLLVRKGSMHTVQAGETLKKIAENHGLKVEDIAAMNKMDLKAVLKPNQVLLIDNEGAINQGVLATSGKDTQVPVTTPPIKQPVMQSIGKDIYIVEKDGETLKSIAIKLKKPDIDKYPAYTYMKTWNNIEDENEKLPKGKAIKTSADAITPTQTQFETTQQTSQNLNPDALLTPMNVTQTNVATQSVPTKKNVQLFKDIHVVIAPNETLKTISDKYNFQPIAGAEYYLYLKKWNGIDDENLTLPINKAIRLKEEANLPTEAEIVKAFPPSSSLTNFNGKHTVAQGETLYTIGQRYNVAVKYLEAWNKIDDKNSISIGQELLVQGDMRIETPEYDKLYTDRFHVVQEGETLAEIAKFHKLSIDELKALNNLNELVLKEGQQLAIMPKKKMHEVVQGETLTMIAAKYKLSVQDIAEFNNIPIDYKVKIGETLIIDPSAILPQPMRKENREELAVPPSSGRNTEPTNTINTPDTYYAQVGEKVQDVCSRFNVSVIDFKLWNKLGYEADNLEEGRKYFLKTPTIQDIKPTSSGTPTGNSKYKVGKNETLYTIARKFNLSLYQLREWNSLKTDTVKEGDSLIISKQ